MQPFLVLSHNPYQHCATGYIHCNERSDTVPRRRFESKETSYCIHVKTFDMDTVGSLSEYSALQYNAFFVEYRYTVYSTAPSSVLAGTLSLLFSGYLSHSSQPGLGSWEVPSRVNVNMTLTLLNCHLIFFIPKRQTDM